MKKFIIAILMTLMVATAAMADAYVRKIQLDDGKWYTKEISCKNYNTWRRLFFKEEYEQFENLEPYTTKGGTTIDVKRKVHTELDLELIKEVNETANEGYNYIKRIKLIRYAEKING